MKLDIADKHAKGKTFHLEFEDEKAKMLYGKKIGEEVDGSLIDAKLNGFKLQITGLSNSAGFPARTDVDGVGLRRVLLTKGTGMSGKRSKKNQSIKGLRLKKTIRGNTIAKDIAQVNLKVIQGSKPLAEIFGKSGKVEKVEESGKGDGKGSGKES